MKCDDCKDFSNYDSVMNYVSEVAKGKKIAGKEIQQAAKRFKRDLKKKELSSILKTQNLLSVLSKELLFMIKGKELTEPRFEGHRLF